MAANSEQLLTTYLTTVSADERAFVTYELLRLIRSDNSALTPLLMILNDENDSTVRLRVVKYLASSRPVAAVHALTKSMFDPDPLIRAQAAIGVAGYDDAKILATSLPALFDALPDPMTRTAAERAIRVVTGRSADRITISERERIKQGERPETIWPAAPKDAAPAPSGSRDPTN